MNLTVISRPEIFGPGLWFTIHTSALHAESEEGKLRFVASMNEWVENMHCQHCQKHTREFILTHPYFMYWETLDGIPGLFSWSWELHNEVNRFLNKYTPSLREAYDFWSKTGNVCTDCGSGNELSPTPKTHLVARPH